MRHRRRTPTLTAVALVAAVLAACGEGSATGADVGPGATATTAAAPPADAAGERYEFVGTVLEAGGGAGGSAHGPELCIGAVLDSLPPQCGGVPVAGWSWEGVPGARSESGTTWADGLRLVGTYDGESFTPTEPPTVADPADPADPADRAGPPAPDFSPACDQPTLGDPALVGREHLGAGAAAANALPDLAAVWVDDQGPASEWLLNVEVTGDAAAAEAAVRQAWGGRLCTVAVPDRPTAAELASVQEQLPGVLGETVYSSGTDTLGGHVWAQVLVATDGLQARVDEAFGPGVVVLEGALRLL